MDFQICEECGFGYVEENSEDRKLHLVNHNKVVNGLLVQPIKSEKIIWRDKDDRIVVVTPFSSKVQRIRAQNVARLANEEMRYDFGLYDESERSNERDLHLFLYCHGNRAIGLAMLEKHDFICNYTWKEYDNRIQKQLQQMTPIWTLKFVWVLRKYRRMQIAKVLFEQAIEYLCVKPEKLGIYMPLSADGDKFVRSIFPHSFIAAK